MKPLHKTCHFLAIIAVFSNFYLNAQNASAYSFQALPGTYSTLSSGTTNPIGMSSNDDDVLSNTINIGFTFKFAGIDYTQLKVSSNGWLTFNTSITSSQPSNIWYTVNQQRPAIFPLWDDLQCRNTPRYRVDGTAPNRIFKLEWRNSEWNANADANVISFQVWLYETSNQIDFIYEQGGASVNNGSAAIGMIDQNSKHLALDGTGTNPNALNTFFTFNLSTKPANGQIYRFNPPQYNSDFISSSIGSQIWCPGETRTVSVTVKNVGTQTWSNSSPDINIGVKWNGQATYTNKVDANNLTPGNQQTYNFTVTAPLTAGTKHLIFDVINETDGCNFSGNSGSCKADNYELSSDYIYIKEFPPVNAGSDASICLGGNTNLNGSSVGVYNPTIIFSEDFESYVGGDLPSSGTQWKQTVVSGSSSTSWQIKASCSPLLGSNCLNMNDGLGIPTDCDYRWDQAANEIAWYGTKINATGLNNLKLSFRWKGFGENNIDYGRVCYSLNGSTWVDLPTLYQLQFNWTVANDVALPAALNGQQFYLGYRWINDGGGSSSAPGFIIDDILVVGSSPTPQPVTLTWSPTGSLSNPNIGNPVATPTSTTTYTLTANSSGCTVTDQVIITVDQPSTAPTSVSGTGTFCLGNTVTLSQVGGNLGGIANYQWYTGGCNSTLIGTGASINVTPSSTTTYYVRVSPNGACPATTCANGTITLPTQGTTLSNHNESATCLVNGNNWVHFFHSSGRYIGAINPQGENLGMVTMTSFVDATGQTVVACDQPNNPNFYTSVMARHWLVQPSSQPTNDVLVGLPFDNTENSALQTASLSNLNNNDDVLSINSLKLSRYHGPSNVNSNANDNCFANGGNENTTIHDQISNGAMTSVFPPFSSTAYYSTHSVPQFSELWLHGSTLNSPLASQITYFEAKCEENNKVHVQWETATESNVSYFDIEKSIDGYHWELVDRVNAVGNSNVAQNYALTDFSMSYTNITYYRLSQYDHDGEIKVMKLSSSYCNNDDFTFEVFPNPTSSLINVIIGSESTENDVLHLTDINGKIIYEYKNLENNLVQINIDELAKGFYFVKLSSGKEIQVRKIMKN